jgi:hypothetical protein
MALGAMLSPPDDRDKTLNDFGIALLGALPQAYIHPYIPTVGNQGSYGMCVAFAISSIIESLEYQERGRRVPYSKAWIYGNREQDDFQGEGMYSREGLKQVSRLGTPELSLLPIIGTYPACKDAISKDINLLLPNAISQKIKGYVRLRNIQEVKTFIYTYECPILVIIDVYESFYNTGSDGIVSPNSGTYYGRHAMIAHGWYIIDGKPYIYGQNSWSEQWGKGGFWYIDPTTCPFVEMWGLLNELPQSVTDRPKEILMTIDNNKMIIDGKEKVIPQGPIIYNDKTMIPVREFAEALGYKVKYYPSGDPKGKGSLVYIKNGGEYSDINNIQ